jgi:hypothetical protein
MEDTRIAGTWLRIVHNHSNDPRTIAFKRDGQTVQDRDSGLRTQSLSMMDFGQNTPTPTKHLACRTQWLLKLQMQLKLTTLDTTSQNSTSQIDTLGDGASGLFYERAITNDRSGSLIRLYRSLSRFGMLTHWNVMRGVTLFSLCARFFRSRAIKGKIAIAVGGSGDKAVWSSGDAHSHAIHMRGVSWGSH